MFGKRNHNGLVWGGVPSCIKAHSRQGIFRSSAHKGRPGRPSLPPPQWPHRRLISSHGRAAHWPPSFRRAVAHPTSWFSATVGLPMHGANERHDLVTSPARGVQQGARVRAANLLLSCPPNTAGKTIPAPANKGGTRTNGYIHHAAARCDVILRVMLSARQRIPAQACHVCLRMNPRAKMRMAIGRGGGVKKRRGRKDTKTGVGGEDRRDELSNNSIPRFLGEAIIPTIKEPHEKGDKKKMRSDKNPII